MASSSMLYLFYNLLLFYWHFLEILWMFIFLVLYFSFLLAYETEDPAGLILWSISNTDQIVRNSGGCWGTCLVKCKYTFYIMYVNTVPIDH